MAKPKFRAARAPARRWTALPIDAWLGFLERSKAWLAAETGYSEPYISLLASGKKRYNQDNIERISRAMGITPAMLLHKPSERDFWEVWNSLDPDQQRRAGAVIKAFRDAG